MNPRTKGAALRWTTIASLAAALACMACDSSTRSGDAGSRTADGRGTAFIGSACEPAAVPSGGFEPTESYFETAAPECGAGLCMVYKLDGDPRAQCTSDCASPTDAAERVFCTCRCAAPDDASAACACPEDFRCEPIHFGGRGIEGSYCVRASLPAPSG